MERQRREREKKNIERNLYVGRKKRVCEDNEMRTSTPVRTPKSRCLTGVRTVIRFYLDINLKGVVSHDL